MAAPQVAVQSSNEFTGFIKTMKTQTLNEQFKLNLEHSPINQEFESAASKMRDYLLANKKKVSSKVKLTLFALYQQGQFGNCDWKKPAFYNFDKKDEYDAWISKKDIPMEQA